jgi:integrase
MVNGKRRKKYVYGPTRTEAAKRLQAVQGAIASGRPLVDERTRVGDFLDLWLKDVIKPHRSYGHWRNCDAHVRVHIKPALGAVPLVKLTAADVQRLLNEVRSQGRADDTVRLVHASLRAALGVAKRWGLVYDNVATLVEPLQIRRAETVPFTEDQVSRLLAVASQERLGAFLTVALALGLRPGEARGLRWEDVELDGATPCLRVRRAFSRSKGGQELGEPKTPRSRRTIPLPQPCIRALRAHRIQQTEERLRIGPAWEDTGLVFTTEKGAPLTEKTLSRWFRRMMEDAEITGHRLYDCRHTAASFLLAQGVHPRVLMEILGHSTYRLTMDTYAHVMPAGLREAADAMDRQWTRLDALAGG